MIKYEQTILNKDNEKRKLPPKLPHKGPRNLAAHLVVAVMEEAQRIALRGSPQLVVGMSQTQWKGYIYIYIYIYIYTHIL